MGPILLLILLSQGAGPAFAQTATPPSECSLTPEAELDLFCEDPNAYVCDTPIEPTPVQLDFKAQRQDALKMLGRELGYADGVFNDFSHTGILLKNYKPQELLSILAKQTKRLISIANASIYRQTGKIPHVDRDVHQAFARAKETIAGVIRTKYKNEGAKRVKFLKKLEDTPLYTAYDFEPAPDRIYDPKTGYSTLETNTARTANPNAESFLLSYVSHCAANDLSDVTTNAGLATNPENQHAIVLCPGFLVNLIFNSTDPHTIAEVEFLFGHELGHAFFDLNDHPDTVACIRNTFIAPMEIDPKIQQLTAEGIANEYVADLYGIKVLLRRLDRVKGPNPAATTQAQLHVMRNALRFLCGTYAGGGHPSGSFRIEQIFRRDPVVDTFFGCRVKTKEPQFACTLSGKSKSQY